jgi:hypothetical protein
MREILQIVWGAIVAAVTFVVGALRDFFVWLRKPGNKIKFACAVLAFITAIAAMRAYEAEQQIVLVTAACDEAKGDLTETIGARDLTIAQKNQALGDIERTLNAEAAKLRELQLQNVALAAENERKALAAEVSAEAFRREFNRKPATCSAALEAMEAACPTLRDY